MTFKKTLTGVILIGLVAGLGFANGAVEEDGDFDQFRKPGSGRYFDGDCGRGGRGGMSRGGFDGRNPEDFQLPETEAYSGIFELEDGEYPVIETVGGERYYLMVRFPIAGEDLPDDGEEISIEAFVSPMSPVHLMVVTAEIDGETYEWDQRMGPGGRIGGRAPRGSNWNRPTWGSGSDES